MIVFCKLIQYVNVKVKKQGHTDISKVDDYIRVQMSGNDEASCLKQATYEFDTSQGWDAISNRKASRRSMLSSEAAAALKAPPPSTSSEDFLLLRRLVEQPSPGLHNTETISNKQLQTFLRNRQRARAVRFVSNI